MPFGAIEHALGRNGCETDLPTEDLQGRSEIRKASGGNRLALNDVY